MSAHVLIVDDVFAQRELLRDVLERGGHVVIGEAGSGGEALARYQENRPDLVLLDLVLPGQNGVEVARSILSVDPSAQIIALSGLSQPSVQAAALDAGMKSFVAKPIDANDLLREIADVLGA